MFPVELVFPLPEGGFHMARRTVGGTPQTVVKVLRAHSEAELQGLLKIGWKQQAGPTTIEGQVAGKQKTLSAVR